MISEYPNLSKVLFAKQNSGRRNLRLEGERLHPGSNVSFLEWFWIPPTNPAMVFGLGKCAARAIVPGPDMATLCSNWDLTETTPAGYLKHSIDKLIGKPHPLPGKSPGATNVNRPQQGWGWASRNAADAPVKGLKNVPQKQHCGERCHQSRGQTFSSLFAAAAALFSALSPALSLPTPPQCHRPLVTYSQVSTGHGNTFFIPCMACVGFQMPGFCFSPTCGS